MPFGMVDLAGGGRVDHCILPECGHRRGAVRVLSGLLLGAAACSMYLLYSLPSVPDVWHRPLRQLQDTWMSPTPPAEDPLGAWERSLQSQMLMLEQASPLVQATCRLLAEGAVKDKGQLQLLQRLRDVLPQESAASSPPDIQPGAGLGPDQDCTEWRRRRGFHRWPVTQQERDFPLAFSFKVHTDPAMFERFLSVLWRPHNWYCLHVDSKTPGDVFRRVLNVTRCFDNVVMTSVRHNVVHASIVSLHADLECAKLATNASVPWRYHISSCGTEFPLKTNLEMVQILSLLNGTNDIENYKPSPKFYNWAWLNRRVLRDPTKANAGLQRTNETRAPFRHKHVEIRKGCAYNSVTRSFLRWALTDKVNQDLLEWLKDSWAPDEAFWATLSYRPEAPGGPGVEVAHAAGSVVTMATIWPWDKGHKCQGTKFRSSCVFGSLDLGWLLSRHELLANKFSPDFDDTVLRCLEVELERRAVTGYIAWSALRRLRHDHHHHQQQQQPAGGPGSRFGYGEHGWPVLPHLNWTLYMSLPHFAGRGHLPKSALAPSAGSNQTSSKNVTSKH